MNRVCRERAEKRGAKPHFGVCEIATTMILSAGITGEILQNRETWLQCRQQVARDLSRGNVKSRWKMRFLDSKFRDTCCDVEST